MRTGFRALLVALSVLAASSSSAQVPGFSVSKQFKLDRLGGDHWRLTGQVEMERGDQKFFADVVDYFTTEDRIEASGNVVYVSKESRIAADRLTFNAKTNTGTFFNASGTMTLTTKVERSMFGSQEPEAYFYGERIEKVAPTKYRVHKGGFSTCVQPTPRWEIATSSATLTVDEYAILKNAVLNVKGVPLLYLPVLYYPINKDDRSTGFLIPQYGNSTLRGQTLSSAFFWAINRSSDATVNYDWFSLTGQAVGGEYRYIAAPGSEGNIRTYVLQQNATSYETGGSLPESQSFEIRGTAIQKLPGNMRARANVDYFSDITVQQSYYSNLYDASRRQRVYGGNVSGAWGAWNLSGTYNRNELFYGDTDSVTNGYGPRISFGRAQRKIGASPVYWSFGTDYSTVLREFNAAGVTVDQGLNKFEFVPQVRVPFTRWPFLQLNGVVVWRNTWYSESLDTAGRQVEDPLLRQYLDLRGEVIGPTFTRVWDTPGNGYAEKFKHVVEPNFSVQRVTAIDNYDEIPKLDSSDYTFGGTTRIGYGLTQRFLARQRSDGRVNSREFLNVSLTQAYFTDERATLYDPAFMSSFAAGMEPSKFTPVALQARALPSQGANGSFRLEYDPNQSMITSMRANGSVNIKGSSVTAGWSQRKYELQNIFSRSDNYLNLGTNLRFAEGRLGGQYIFDYDFSRDRVMQQRIMGFYNAQCCGITVEYQRMNFPTYVDPRFAVPNDKRFTISFTLAGVGTFASPLGMLGGSTYGSNGRF